jgi:hypothetical protein
MRAIVCTDFAGTLRKLIWITENRTGVSAGICETPTNPHATYHVDGTHHHKLTHRGRTLKVFPEKKTPIRNIKGQEQLLGTAAFYVEDTMKRLPEFTPDGRAWSIVVLGQSVFRGIGAASFNSYIVHRKAEAQFLKTAYTDYECGNFLLVAVHMFSLECFPDHKVGLIVYRGKGKVEPSAGGNAALPRASA